MTPPVSPEGAPAEDRAVVTATAPIVEVSGLSKRFGSLRVLDDLSTDIPVGQVTALVGPNAAGKSTLIKSILGMVRPDQGRILVNGRPVTRDADYRRGIGYMPQTSHFPENLSGREVLAMLHHLRGPSTEVDEELLDAFGLASELDKQVRTLSGGTRQKLNAVIAFLFRPPLLILDEPTAGLDPVASGILKEKILRSRSAGASFLISSHVMSELEDLTDTVIYLVDGIIPFQGPRAELHRRTGETRLDRAVAALMNGGAG